MFDHHEDHPDFDNSPGHMNAVVGGTQAELLDLMVSKEDRIKELGGTYAFPREAVLAAGYPRTMAMVVNATEVLNSEEPRISVFIIELGVEANSDQDYAMLAELARFTPDDVGWFWRRTDLIRDPNSKWRGESHICRNTHNMIMYPVLGTSYSIYMSGEAYRKFEAEYSVLRIDEELKRLQKAVDFVRRQ